LNESYETNNGHQSAVYCTLNHFTIRYDTIRYDRRV